MEAAMIDLLLLPAGPRRSREQPRSAGACAERQELIRRRASLLVHLILLPAARRKRKPPAEAAEKIVLRWRRVRGLDAEGTTGATLSLLASSNLSRLPFPKAGRGSRMAAGASGEQSSTRERLLAALDDLELLARELIEFLAISRNQKLAQPGEESQILELLIQRDKEFQELMKLALDQGKIHHEMQVLEKVVEKRDNDIQQLQKQLKEAEHILATAVYQAKEKLKSIEKARKGAVSSEEIIKYAHRISASNAVCAPLTWVPGDPRRPYPTDLEMRSGLLGQMNNPSANGVNGHLPGDALAAGRLPDVLAPQYPWQSSDISMNMLPPNHSNDFMLEPPGHNKENEDDVEVMSTDSSSSSSDSD
ncbi:mediator of RNA polymerase II transcription subunit 4 isoform X1 [Erythrolamprus reginae]|uniref:mediator of RNA polymerase II transcription subunit 4 isoform X1 n=2 Tax=Erythrolamprus reginae TaxID=121349 RepID=UPI00396C949A